MTIHEAFPPMTFHPRMTNTIHGFTVVGGVYRRQWNGIVADVWDVECQPHAGGHYLSRDPRLFILLEKGGDGLSSLRLSPHAPAGADGNHAPISYVPAGVDVWADFVGLRTVRHLDLHFEAETLSRRLMETVDPRRLERPRVSFFDERVLALARLIAAECLNPQPLHDLYGDGLAVALIVDLLKLERSSPRSRGALSAWQLRRVKEFIDEHCLRNIRLEELARLTGLSASHFSHAFKASTGVGPHRWQLCCRLERAKQMLCESEQPLTEIAVETGFADQAHFTRTFRKLVGTTPAEWRKAQAR